MRACEGATELDQRCSVRHSLLRSDISIIIQWFKFFGGEGGIRTHGTVARTPHFECGAFDHSATSPLGVRAGRANADADRTGALAARFAIA